MYDDSLRPIIVDPDLRAKIKHASPGTPFEHCQILHNLCEGCTDNDVVIEIGSFLGRSTLALAYGMQRGKLITIDSYSGMSNHSMRADQSARQRFLSNIECIGTELPKLSLYTVLGDSLDEKTIDMVWGIVENHHLHLVFIDGCHTGEHPVCDYENYFGYLHSGSSMVAFHDNIPKYPAVQRTVLEAIRQPGSQWVIGPEPYLGLTVIKA